MGDKLTSLQGVDVNVDETTKRARFDLALQAIAEGTGNPFALSFSDPGSDSYAVASPVSTGVITRACSRLRVGVGDSGMVISLDGGATDHITVFPNTMDGIAVAIASGADVRVRRYTAGVAMTDIVVEVR